MDATIVFTQHQKLLPPMDLVLMMGSERGKRFPLLGGRVTFGRSSDNNLVLSDSTISGHHGVLVYAEEGEVLFYDTASRNGISVDGKRSQTIKLKAGQRIQIGSVYLKLVPSGQGLDAEPFDKGAVLRGALWKRKQAWMPIGTVLLCLASFPGFFSPEKSQPDHSVATSLSRPTVPADRSPVQKQKPSRRPRISAGRESRPEPKKTGFVEASQLVEQGQAAFEQGRLQEAQTLWKEAAAKDPFNPSAQEGFQKLETEAGKLFEEALMTQSSSPEESRQKTELAISISGPSSKVHTRAQAWLIDGS